MEKLKDYFKRYPTSQEVYENGGQLFHNRGAADSYGKGETKKYTRKEVVVEKAEKKELSAEETARIAQEKKDGAISTLKGIEDLNAADYKELFSLFQDLGLKAENNKKPSVIQALTEFKETLKDE